MREKVVYYICYFSYLEEYLLWKRSITRFVTLLTMLWSAV